MRGGARARERGTDGSIWVDLTANLGSNEGNAPGLEPKCQRKATTPKLARSEEGATGRVGGRKPREPMAAVLARVQAAARAQRAASVGKRGPLGGRGVTEQVYLPNGAVTHCNGLYLARSSIPALDEQGLFTAEAVQPGGFVGLFTGYIVKDDVINALSATERDRVLEWAMDIGDYHSLCPWWPGSTRHPGEGGSSQGSGSSVWATRSRRATRPYGFHQRASRHAEPSAG